MDKLPKFKFTLADNQEELLEQKSQVEALSKKAKIENPACAAGGCGGKCGTEECVKKMQGALNKINKALQEAYAKHEEK